jgi:hypothetical protein
LENPEKVKNNSVRGDAGRSKKRKRKTGEFATMEEEKAAAFPDSGDKLVRTCILS